MIRPDEKPVLIAVRMGDELVLVRVIQISVAPVAFPNDRK